MRSVIFGVTVGCLLLAGMTGSVAARTWLVPSEVPTIAAAIDSAGVGDTVEVACGIYYEHELMMKSGVTLISETADPECVTIHGGNYPIIICNSVDDTARIEGIRFIWGDSSYLGYGGGIHCNDSSPDIVRCTFEYCQTSVSGLAGGIWCGWGSAPEITDCLFQNNTYTSFGGGFGCDILSAPVLTRCMFRDNSSSYGGAAYAGGNAVFNECWFVGNNASYGGGAIIIPVGGTPTFNDCVMMRNGSGRGGAIYADTDSAPILNRCTIVASSAPGGGGGIWCNSAFPVMDRTIIAFSMAGTAVECAGTAAPILSCSNLYGNAGGDWTGCVEDQEGANGNFSADPVFCDPAHDGVHLASSSPCANAPGCGQIGALDIGCSEPAPPRTWLILPDGLGDAPTIQAGIDSSWVGDTVQLSCGTYYEHDLYMKNGITLRGETGDPECVTVDAEQQGRVIDVVSCGSGTLIEGISITGGRVTSPSYTSGGGGLRSYGSIVTISACQITGNEAVGSGGAVAVIGGTPSFIGCEITDNTVIYNQGRGGGVYCEGGDLPVFEDCVIARNTSARYGGGLCTLGVTPSLDCCTLVSNSAPEGAGIYSNSGPPLMNRSIVAFNLLGVAVKCFAGSPVPTCTDIYGNQGGDWVGPLTGYDVVNGNLAADPVFCDTAGDDFTLHSISPCADAPGCGIIGALGVGCYGQTWQVPGDAATIQGGMDLAAVGDTIVVACGTYYEHDIVLKPHVCLRSETGEADCVVIDAQQQGRVASGDGLGSTTLIEGFTFTGGVANYGGGLYLVNGSPAVVGCAFDGNTASYGGGVYVGPGISPDFSYCSFSGNSNGGGLYCYVDSAPTATRCTVHGNGGVGVYVYSASPVLQGTLITGTNGPSVGGTGASFPFLTCCDVYGNLGGDWVGYIASQAGINGNFSADPLYCNAEAGYLYLNAASPCVDRPGCGQVGAFGVGCPRTWAVPDDVATIEEGLYYATAGDTVSVACGTYYEHALDLKSGVTVRSETGDADCVTVDAEALERAFFAFDVTGARLEGLTITNGLRNWGAGIYILQSSMTVEDCVFHHNIAEHVDGGQGGGLCIENSDVVLRGLTVVHNEAYLGDGIALFTSPTQVENCIIAFNDGYSIFCHESAPVLTCTDIFGNLGWNWYGCIADQQGVNGNLDVDPLFCDADAADYHLRYLSPCRDAAGCGQIGALGFGGCGGLVQVPGDAATIQAGIDAAVYGDTVVVECGTYQEYAIGLKTGVVVRSETGQADCVTIDGQAMSRVFYATGINEARLEGFTVTNGLARWGAGIYLYGSPITVANCAFRDNVAEWEGAQGQGGGVCVEACNPTLTNVTIAYNTGPEGGGVALYGASPVMENCLVAYNEAGVAVYCNASAPVISCTDIYGNPAGDWVGTIAGQLGIAGNISADPFFCPDPYNPLSLDAISPCLPANNDCGVLMGALGEGCDLIVAADEEPVPTVPDRVYLAQNSPNPFNPTTTIGFGLPEPRRVRLTVYDLRGRRITRLVDGELPAGTYRVEWQGRDDRGSAVASGTYVCCLEAGAERQTMRMTLIR